MAYWKKIANSNAVPVLKEDLVFDTTPTVNSFNPVTSDGVARAVAGASGEVPVVTENDNGKVLSAIYDEHGPAVEWADAPSGVPEYSASEAGKVLGVVLTGVEETPELDWVDQPADELPAISSGDAGKVLKVNAGETGVEWGEVSGGGSSYTAGDGIAIDGNEISVSHNDSISVVGLPATYTTTVDPRVMWNGSSNRDTDTAFKIKLGDTSYQGRTKPAEFKFNYRYPNAMVSVVMPEVDHDMGLSGSYVKLVLANPSDGTKYAVSTAKTSVAVGGSYNSEYHTYYSGIEVSNLVFSGSLYTLFDDYGPVNWDNLKDADGYTNLYFALCDASGAIITTGSCGPTNTMYVLGIGSNGTAPMSLSMLPSDLKGIGVTSPVPTPGNSDSGKVLTVTNTSGAFGWAAAPSELPSVTGNAGKVLTVNSGATGVEWAAAGGGSSASDAVAYITLPWNGTSAQKIAAYNAISTALAAGKAIIGVLIEEDDEWRRYLPLSKKTSDGSTVYYFGSVEQGSVFSCSVYIGAADAGYITVKKGSVSMTDWP